MPGQDFEICGVNRNTTRVVVTLDSMTNDESDYFFQGSDQEFRLESKLEEEDFPENPVVPKDFSR